MGGGNLADFRFISENDLVAIGNKAAEAGLKCRFPNFLVPPINNIKEGLKVGSYNGYYEYFDADKINLRQISTVQKKVSLVPLNRLSNEDEYLTFLKKHWLKPCFNAPNYLLGLMSQFHDDEIPSCLLGKNFVAAEPDNCSSIFKSKEGKDSFLCVIRNKGNRKLSMTNATGGWLNCWAFLAESI